MFFFFFRDAELEHRFGAAPRSGTVRKAGVGLDGTDDMDTGSKSEM